MDTESEPRIETMSDNNDETAEHSEWVAPDYTPHIYNRKNEAYWKVMTSHYKQDTLFMFLYAIDVESQPVRYFHFIMALECYVIAPFRNVLSDRHVRILRMAALPVTWPAQNWDQQMDAIINEKKMRPGTSLENDAPSIAGAQRQMDVDYRFVLDVATKKFYEFLEHYGPPVPPRGVKKTNEVFLFMAILAYIPEFFNEWLRLGQETQEATAATNTTASVDDELVASTAAAKEGVCSANDNDDDDGIVMTKSGIRVADPCGLRKFFEYDRPQCMSIKSLVSMTLCGSNIFSHTSGTMPVWMPLGADHIGYQQRMEREKTEKLSGSYRLREKIQKRGERERKKLNAYLKERAGPEPDTSNFSDMPQIVAEEEKRRQMRSMGLGLPDRYMAVDHTPRTLAREYLGKRDRGLEDAEEIAITPQVFADHVYAMYPVEVACCDFAASVVEAMQERDAAAEEEMWANIRSNRPM